jgi:hypothetical protein
MESLRKKNLEIFVGKIFNEKLFLKVFGKKSSKIVLELSRVKDFKIFGKNKYQSFFRNLFQSVYEKKFSKYVSGGFWENILKLFWKKVRFFLEKKSYGIFW